MLITFPAEKDARGHKEKKEKKTVDARKEQKQQQRVAGGIIAVAARYSLSFLMGGQSQSRKSPVKAMKAKATRTKNAFGMSPTSRKKAIQQLEATHSRAKQHTMHGQRSQSVADGTKVCRACLMKAQGAVYKKGHDITCPRSKKFGTSQSTIAVLKTHKKYMETNNARPVDDSPISKDMAHAASNAFFVPRPKSIPTEAVDDTSVTCAGALPKDPVAEPAIEEAKFAGSPPKDPVAESARIEGTKLDRSLSPEILKKEVRTSRVEKMRMQKKETKHLIAVHALMSYLLELCPSKFKSDSNE